MSTPPRTPPAGGQAPIYARFPTLHDDTLVFVHDDDLWAVSVRGGVARRLTAGAGSVSHPHFSPDGTCIAFCSNEEGHAEVFVMDAEGGNPTRLTFHGEGICPVLGWADEDTVLHATAAGQPYLRSWFVRAVPAGGGPTRATDWGTGVGVALHDDGSVAVCRHLDDLARWKRYRGGRVGQVWVQRKGKGKWQQLKLPGNVCSPLWVGKRLVFVSDEDRTGNLYSCTPTGKGLKQLTHHDGFYVRWPCHHGGTVVYCCGGDLYRLDAGATEPVRIDVRCPGPRTWTQRRFASPVRHLEDYDLHPDGHSLVLTVRGQVWVMGNWEGAALRLGTPGARYRLARFHADGERIIAVSDASGEDRFEVLRVDGSQSRTYDHDVGRPVLHEVDPSGRRLAFTNQDFQVGVIDLEDDTCTLLDTDGRGPPDGVRWSGDGQWLVWTRVATPAREASSIHLWNSAQNEHHTVGDGRYRNLQPSFDRTGKYLYFLSAREFDPVYDAVYFDLNFPKGLRPYLVTLQADTADPFLQEPRPLVRPPIKPKNPPDAVSIDFDGIDDRLLRFPVYEARYQQMWGINGQVLISRAGVHGSLTRNWFDRREPPSDSALYLFDYDKFELSTMYPKITDFRVNLKGDTIAYRAGWKLRVVKAKDVREDKSKAKNDARPGRKTGYVDLNRIRPEVHPPSEWAQMLRETWRLMRDNFWNAGMSGQDWDAIWDRYAPLLPRVASRAEYADLVWCMQGELGTSHAYEMGGDYRPRRAYRVGQLAADFHWDDADQVWRITHIARGEPGDPKRTSPLIGPGLGLSHGDRLLAVQGQPLDGHMPPESRLVHQADRLVQLTVADANGDHERRVTVKALVDQRPVRHRHWVCTKRAYVHEATEGRVGYLHIPDMGPGGYAEFHRDYLTEVHRDALIVDVRFNRGGHVSQLLLEKLARRALGFKVSRHGQPNSYPAHTMLGPMVCLTNEMAGSDGDIFSHSWKLLNLGPLIGKRTWGGVVGIWPRNWMVDGSMTTQPESASWFEDVRWQVENHGTDPDIEVAIPPDDESAGRDPQLDRAIREISAMLRDDLVPDFGPTPNLSGNEDP